MRTPKWSCLLFFALSLVFIFSSTAKATIVSYALTDLGSRQWQIDYKISGFDSDLYDDLTIYFDYDKFENLTLVACPVSWDAYVSDPVVIFGSEEDGLLDARVDEVGGMLDATFSVQASYLGADIPGPQFFELFNSNNWETPVAGGTTSPVPVPGALGLMLSGLAGIYTIRRKSGKNQ